MKRTVIATALAAVFLAGCSESEPKVEKVQQVEQTAGKAELGTFGVDLKARDESVKPGDDFFMYASGTWYKNYEMPADKTRYGAFTCLLYTSPSPRDRQKSRMPSSA